MEYGYDEETPRGFSDADLEQTEFERQGAERDAIRARGFCTHGWFQGHEDGSQTCLHDGCGATFASFEEAVHAEPSRFASSSEREHESRVS